MDTEFFCPYCGLWITDITHRENHHNDPDEVDNTRVSQHRRKLEKSKEKDK